MLHLYGSCEGYAFAHQIDVIVEFVKNQVFSGPVVRVMLLLRGDYDAALQRSRLALPRKIRIRIEMRAHCGANRRRQYIDNWRKQAA